MAYDREPRYIHPFIFKQLKNITDAITAKLPAGHTARLVSAHRSPADQFELYKKGRTFKNGVWTKTGSVVTYKDGYVNLSRHNYLPCTAFDIGLFNNNTYLPDSPLYKKVKEGTKFGLDWGGDWTGFKDEPHLEIPMNVFFKSNIQKDMGLIWQKYLVKAGTYNKSLDGIFGDESLKSLKAATGETQRNLAAWDKLYNKFGAPEWP
jgi:peptidoglycan L-alanyl-D-glutamate endopeptidase CwlK